MASDLTTLTSQLAAMKQTMVNRLTAQGVSGVTTTTPMQTIVDDFATLRKLDYDTTTITENGTYVAPNGKTGYNNFVVNVPAGGPATHRMYEVLDRVYEDLNSEPVGTVVGFHYDANNVEYAVVVLDAAYRLASGQITSTSGTITGLPTYSGGTQFSAKETATFNCDKILAQCTTSGWTSSAVSHCRAQTFTIIGNTYAGQVPTIMELVQILEWRTEINAADTTATANPTLVIPSSSKNIWSSTRDGSYSWGLVNNMIDSKQNTTQHFVVPVIEIPNTTA